MAGESSTVESRPPTFAEGRVISHDAVLFAYSPKIVEETFSEDQDPA